MALTASLHQHHEFESSASVYLHNSDIDNEVIAINIQIETELLIKIFMVCFQCQMNKITYLNHWQDPSHQPHQKWRMFLHDHTKDSIRNDYLKPNLLVGKGFSLMFHIFYGRFEQLM